MTTRQRLGEQGETLAGRFLESRGYRILARRWRADGGARGAGQGAEADIVAEKGGVIAFVEVRTRRAGGRFGSPEESVTARKRGQLRRAARAYMAAHAAPGRPYRIDVIAVELGGLGGGVLRHLENAVGED